MAKAVSAAIPPSSNEENSTVNKPVRVIRYRNLKAAIWRNTGQSGVFHSVTFSRGYQDDQQQWHDVSSFNTGDLPMLAKLANDCHSWAASEERRAADEKGGRG